ncbi:MAG: aminotransferase class III-fold pyridoxal phosphate-dependent enzyme [Acidobacteria bacterium]|nr:aminotransferase class III-fold pyridoxal phosphate-dependent enzyme [Acidobacteriota bacterium]
MSAERKSVLHSWCVQADWDAPTIVGGQGARFRDDRGRTYVDMSSLAECMNLGHQHPALIKAIQAQAATLCFTTAAWGAEPRARLAELLLEKSGFEGGRVFFTLGGADANEHAVKFTRQASNNPSGLIITRDRSYHGASYAAMAFSGDSRTIAQADPARYGVIHVPPPYAYRCPFGSTSEAECGTKAAARIGRTIDAHPGTSAVLMEPDAGTNGIVAPDTFWPALRQETRKRGVSLIADEVMSAFGRCGEWFAWQRYGEAGRPDLMTLAKGLTGAHIPLGAVVLSAGVAAKLERQMLYTGLTYSGHPLACAAGVAAIQAYEDEGLIERSRTLGAWMFQQLRAMQARHPVIGDVRGGHGLFAVLELVKDRATREPLRPWPDVHPALKSLVDRGRAAGVSFAIRGNLVLLAPPLVIAETDLSEALALLDRLIAESDWS